MENSIGKRIKALRKDKGWGQELLAEKMNVVQSLVAKVESGTRKLTVDEAIKLAELFETSTDYILRGSKPEFVNVSSDLGLNEGAIDNLRTVQRLIRDKGKTNSDGRLDNQDIANFLLSYDGWFIVDALCDFFNTPKDDTVNVPSNTSKGEAQTWHCVNTRSIILVKLQDVLSQMYDRVKRR